jgi:hypothetical protein
MQKVAIEMGWGKFLLEDVSDAALPLWNISLGGLKLSAVETFCNYDSGCKNL